MTELKVFKIGGGIINDTVKLNKFLKEFALTSGLKILIHGGGAKLSELCRTMGIQPRMVEGRRITCEKTVEMAAMVYAGSINKNIVATLQSLNCNAMGLSGIDGGLVKVKKRSASPVDFGQVGDVLSVNTSLITALLDMDITPVICPLSGSNGQLLNINADTIASHISTALSVTYQVEWYCLFEHNGVLLNPAKSETIMPTLTASDFEKMKIQGNISNGMIPKLDNAFRSLKNGVKGVVITSPENVFKSNSIKTVLQ